MRELSGRISNIAISCATGKPLLTLEVNEDKSTLQNMYEELKATEKLTIKIAKATKRRSLDANAYCFVLIGKIAEKTNVPKEEVYRKAIKEIGGNYDVVCVQDKAVEALCESWRKMGLGWQAETFPSKLDGCTNVTLYYGSSTYDVPTMSRLIDNIVQDCKALGIETKSSEELESLLGAWGK
jgi:hypothetical protein